MRYIRLFLIISSTLCIAGAEARALTYEQCADRSRSRFREGELDALKELQRSFVELKDFPEMQKMAKRSYEFGLMLRKQHLDLALQINKQLCSE
jgi:hypothetical protein